MVKPISAHTLQSDGASSCQALNAQIYRFAEDQKTMEAVMAAFSVFPSVDPSIVRIHSFNILRS
jgi:hypothetical protein